MNGHMARRRDNIKISLFLAALSPAGCADWPLSRVERHVASVHEADRIAVRRQRPNFPSPMDIHGPTAGVDGREALLP